MTERLLPAHIRGGRGLLDWSMLDLARAAGLSVSTVKRMEAGTGQPVSLEAFSMVRATLETAGVLVLPTDEDGIGLRLRAR